MIFLAIAESFTTWESLPIFLLKSKTANFNSLGNDITEILQVKGTTPVDKFGVANKFGLSDMHGNVLEWCSDKWHDDYHNAPRHSSPWITLGVPLFGVLRGGAWSSTATSIVELHLE